MNGKKIIIGRLKGEPEVISEGLCKFIVCNTTIDSCGNQNSVSYNCFANNRQSEVVMKYLHSGDLCCIEGKRFPYDKQQGGYQSNRISAERIVFLTPKDKRGCIYPN